MIISLQNKPLSHQHILHYTETEMSSFWWNFHHWLHWKLSKWQLPVQPVIKISSKWRHFRFSVGPCTIINPGNYLLSLCIMKEVHVKTMFVVFKLIHSGLNELRKHYLFVLQIKIYLAWVHWSGFVWVYLTLLNTLWRPGCKHILTHFNNYCDLLCLKYVQIC